ncbi:MAG: LacI family transcriptional regulator [Clostridiaceae bacterium]|nr:LacI family transcriptional regulator [Clostridiaceae bacterium]
MAATIKDVARLAGLSIATVSKYINGGHVIDANSAAIEQAIKTLDYRVNTMARGLKTKKTKSIGVLIPSVRMVFCMDIISAIEDELSRENFSTMICDCQGRPEQEAVKIEFLLEKQVDGIIMMPSSNSSEAARRAALAGIPVVLVDRRFNTMECDRVLVDNRQLAEDATTELLQAGHRRIGIICGPEDIYTTVQRLNGYYQAYEKLGLEAYNDCISFSDYSLEGGYKALDSLMELPEPPTAVLATNYETTIGSVMAINRSGLKIPEDLSFVGFDSLDMSTLVTPALTMAIQPVQEIGEQAARLMLRRLDPQDKNKKSESGQTHSDNKYKGEEIILTGKLNRGASIKTI